MFWGRFIYSLILREQQSPGPAFDVLYNSIMKRLLHLTSYLAGKIRGIDQNCEEARLLAVTIFGQVVVFRASRAAVLKQTYGLGRLQYFGT